MTAESRSVPPSSRALPQSGLARAAITSTQIVAWMRANWALLAVYAAFALAAVVVPTLTPVATTDDWAYARSAQILLDQARLTIFPVVAATAVFQIVWGALFGFIFGPTLGIFRLSTVVITALGGLALYGLCRDLGVARGPGALGVATFLFNPLVFVLAFTFMTDAHFMALLVIATWLYAKALGPEEIDGRLLVTGSGVAALAFLTRQQGILIASGGCAVSAALAALAPRPGQPPGPGPARCPAAAGGGRLLPLAPLRKRCAAGPIDVLSRDPGRGLERHWWLLRRLTVVELMYLGLFTLPLIAAALPAVRRARTRHRSSWMDPVCGVASDPPCRRHGVLGDAARSCPTSGSFRLWADWALRTSSARGRSCSVPRSARR